MFMQRNCEIMSGGGKREQSKDPGSFRGGANCRGKAKATPCFFFLFLFVVVVVVWEKWMGNKVRRWMSCERGCEVVGLAEDEVASRSEPELS